MTAREWLMYDVFDQIPQVLEIVQLSEAIRAFKDELEAPVQEYGSNFSMGQRQVREEQTPFGCAISAFALVKSQISIGLLRSYVL